MTQGRGQVCEELGSQKGTWKPGSSSRWSPHGGVDSGYVGRTWRREKEERNNQVRRESHLNGDREHWRKGDRGPKAEMEDNLPLLPEVVTDSTLKVQQPGKSLILR
jgi:hypothetical protein